VLEKKDYAYDEKLAVKLALPKPGKGVEIMGGFDELSCLIRRTCETVERREKRKSGVASDLLAFSKIYRMIETVVKLEYDDDSSVTQMARYGFARAILFCKCKQEYILIIVKAVERAHRFAKQTCCSVMPDDVKTAIDELFKILQ
jgi:hypothetical protein